MINDKIAAFGAAAMLGFGALETACAPNRQLQVIPNNLFQASQEIPASVSQKAEESFNTKKYSFTEIRRCVMDNRVIFEVFSSNPYNKRWIVERSYFNEKGEYLGSVSMDLPSRPEADLIFYEELRELGLKGGYDCTPLNSIGGGIP